MCVCADVFPRARRNRYGCFLAKGIAHANKSNPGGVLLSARIVLPRCFLLSLSCALVKREISESPNVMSMSHLFLWAISV